MPIWDWSDYPYHKGWIYISGHTHKNQLLMEDGIAVLADNQVGYEKKPWRFKSFSIDVAWDPVDGPTRRIANRFSMLFDVG